MPECLQELLPGYFLDVIVGFLLEFHLNNFPLCFLAVLSRFFQEFYPGFLLEIFESFLPVFQRKLFLGFRVKLFHFIGFPRFIPEFLPVVFSLFLRVLQKFSSGVTPVISSSNYHELSSKVPSEICLILESFRLYSRNIRMLDLLPRFLPGFHSEFLLIDWVPFEISTGVIVELYWTCDPPEISLFQFSQVLLRISSKNCHGIPLRVSFQISLIDTPRVLVWGFQEFFAEFLLVWPTKFLVRNFGRNNPNEISRGTPRRTIGVITRGTSEQIPRKTGTAQKKT